MAILRITNENHDVQEKVNYFINRFKHFLNNSGIEFQFEIENQLSLLQKIDFQLANDNQYRFVYLDNYLENELFNNSELWSEYNSYKPVEKQINDYNAIAKSGKRKEDKIAEKRIILDSA